MAWVLRTHVPRWGGSHRRTNSKTALTALIGALAAIGLATPTTIYVSPNGKDTWSGSLSAPNAQQTDGPKATLEGAKTRIRQLKQSNSLSAEGAQVLVMPGTYKLSATLGFGAADSGTAAAPIVYKSVVPRGAILDAGKTISAWFMVKDKTVLKRLPASAAKRVLCADLAGQGVSNLGTLKARGAWMSVTPAPLELLVDDSPANLASWPQYGWATIGQATSSNSFKAGSQRSRAWQSLSDTWCQGFFGNNWADYTFPISSYNRATGAISLALSPSYGIKEGMRYRLINALEELDRPGEYFVDRTLSRIYYWPIGPIGSAKTEVTLLEGPLVQFASASNMRFEGFVFKNGRGHGLVAYSSNDIDVVNCEFKNLGNRALYMIGNGCLIHANDIRNTGYGGIYVSGGDRATLTPDNNVITNNQVHDTCRLVPSSEAGIQVLGVGTRVANNAIYDIPEYGVLFSGNDIVIENNEIFRVCLETGDTGAIYIGRDMTMQGNIVRNNLIRDVVAKQANSEICRVVGVYLDDFMSGVTVTGNAFVRCSSGLLIGGGKDNKATNNMFIDTSESIVADGRGMTWASAAVQPGGTVYTRLQAFNLNTPPWTKYAFLSGYLSSDLRVPERNLLRYNLYIDSGQIVSDSVFLVSPNTVASNVSDGKAALMNPANYDFKVVNGSNASTIPFTDILPSTMGLVADSYRLTVPDLRTQSIQGLP
ncbi:MAG: right-handed parallel beta-helix repeat-containing protein [Armatimonadetes bacterium]|nr:right-handed parallel beta-helix repeat-containing protein [Armatimonadota bacterium]